jgi:enterochelin esterase-like enzyme
MRSIIALAFWCALLAFPALAQPLRGTVEQRTFVDEASGRTVRFTVYLPEGYASGGAHYPVVYHLHGLGGSEAAPSNVYLPRSFEAAQDQGIIGPVIVVFPNGYEDSWWADSANSDKPAESDVVGRLVPYIDATYRTIARRGGRIIQGFSMGGFGATKFYAKFNDLFAACIEYDGAFHSWFTFRILFPATAAEVFDNSSARYDQYSPWYWTNAHADILRDGPPVRMVVGLLGPGNRAFRDHLAARQIPVDYAQTSCGHDLECLLGAQGLASAAFIAAHLEAECPADHTHDGVVNSQDFFAYLTDFFASSDAADFNGDGAVNSQDLFDFLAAFFVAC